MHPEPSAGTARSGWFWQWQRGRTQPSAPARLWSTAQACLQLPLVGTVFPELLVCTGKTECSRSSSQGCSGRSVGEETHHAVLGVMHGPAGAPALWG